MKNFVIENGMLKKYIGEDVNVTIPDSVTCIGGSVFNNCKSLKEIIIPNSVTEIGDGAFCECTILQKTNQ